MHLLIIEDESLLLNFLVRHLSAEAYSCHPIQTAQDLKVILDSETILEPDIVILDRLFWGQDLATQIHEIKNKFKHCKVLVLSAIGGAKERAQILEKGADDYLNKPFELEELVARLKCLARRSVQDPQSSIRGELGFVLNEELKDIEVNQQRLNLTKKEYQLVSLLANHPNKVFSRLKLLDSVWDVEADIESNVVEATISNLRKKFEKKSIPCRIQSRRNIGYWLEI
ncbi:MAG: response regulator transcription factor [Bdellovibrionia bacterium]